MNEKNPLAEEILQAARPKLNLALPARPEVPDQAVEAHSKEIGEKWGANTQMASISPPEPEEPTAPLISVRFDCPDYLDRAVSIAAAERNVTKTFIILTALKQAGYEIKDVDLVEDRRKTRRR